MDLNLSYSEHQLMLMKASASTSAAARTKHLATAGLFANRIGTYQRESGASASVGWLRRDDQGAWPSRECHGSSE